MGEGAWTVKGGLARKKGVVFFFFWGGVDTPMHPMCQNVTQNWPITKNIFLPSNYFIFWQFCFSSTTSYKGLIWCYTDLISSVLESSAGVFSSSVLFKHVFPLSISLTEKQIFTATIRNEKQSQYQCVMFYDHSYLKKLLR